MSDRCQDFTRKPRGWFQCVLPKGHDTDPLSLHQIDVTGPSIVDGDPDICAFCLHPIDHHGTTQVGCADCHCGYDSDFHPDPPRGDE